MDELSLLKALLLKVLAQGSLRDIDDLHLALRLVDVPPSSLPHADPRTETCDAAPADR